ncbi:pyrroline-5-carboxylate reductase [Methylosarcina fibrata]|uniref:pyrroline-5-carboxylate reductase n=1 Tax=Methylosarcina fibrata TaxID=105972 RepID=UPI00035DEDCC|nr:pyrroline-5-carboxylate reductase [Methylosarcina fibrata]
MKTHKIGFIGGGNMASSLISGLIASGHASRNIWVSDINPDTLKSLEDKLKVNVSASNEAVVNEAEVIVLAVKPQIMGDVAQQIADLIRQKKTLVVSIAAGITQRSLSRWLGAETAVVRCMPNTPALVLTGATALHANSQVSAEQRNLAETILRSVGIALWVQDESQLDAVTAVSGSGPAYFFLLMEVMEKTAVELGLNEETARLLVQQTALGAAKIALESAESPEQLRKRVTSPGGTTQRAIETFQQGGFSELVNKALHAARDRSIEMSKQAEPN